MGSKAIAPYNRYWPALILLAVSAFSCQRCHYKDTLPLVLGMPGVEPIDCSSWSDGIGLQGEGFTLERYELESAVVDSFIANHGDGSSLASIDTWRSMPWSTGHIDLDSNQVYALTARYFIRSPALRDTLAAMRLLLSDTAQVIHAAHYWPDINNPSRARTYILDKRQHVLWIAETIM